RRTRPRRSDIRARGDRCARSVPHGTGEGRNNARSCARRGRRSPSSSRKGGPRSRMSDLRALPSVDELLRDVPVLNDGGPVVARWLVRREVAAARARALKGDEIGDVRAIVAAAAEQLQRARIRRVINATGVVIHTNLGRAALGEEAVAAAVEAAGTAVLE